VPTAELFPNGVSAAGGPLLAPLDLPTAAARVRGDRVDAEARARLAQAARRLAEPHLGLPFGIDPADVAQAGWGVVVPAEERDALRERLAPLLAHRAQGIDEARLKVLDHRPGELPGEWLARHGVGYANQDPEKVPYYLLLVAEPARVPFEFEFQLAVDYAVGRIAPATAEAYARAVVAHEGAPGDGAPPRAVFFGTEHPDDRATQLSAEHLVRPLAAADRPGVATEAIVGAAATKAALVGALSGTPPAVCLTASHGLGWPQPDPAQRDWQGALICQDYDVSAAFDAGRCFGAADATEALAVAGTIFVTFACYGAGTPEHDAFLQQAAGAPARIAEAPFIARLPQALLARGAVAVVGHVERAWGFSFLGAAGPQLRTFENLLAGLFAGRPVGLAMKDFREKYAALSAALGEMLEAMRFGRRFPDAEVVGAWVERNDARNYALVGDPAVRLRP